jgi:hypothetical protein
MSNLKRIALILNRGWGKTTQKREAEEEIKELMWRRGS